MFNEFFFFTYIIAGFVGFLAILLAVLLKKYWSSGNKQLLAAIRNFMICTACIDAMYFYLNYIFLKTGCYTTTAVPRILDSFTYIGQVYFWSAYIREKCQLPPEKRRHMTVISLWLCGICLITNFASYGFFMDNYYFVAPGILRTLSIIIEILLMFCLAFITIWHLMKGLSELVQKKIRTLVTVISLFITINGLWNAVFSLILMTGALSPPRDLAMDPTGFFLLLINLFTVLLIYQEDFFALFRIEGSQPEALTQTGEEHIGGHKEEHEEVHMEVCSDEQRADETNPDARINNEKEAADHGEAYVLSQLSQSKGGPAKDARAEEAEASKETEKAGQALKAAEAAETAEAIESRAKHTAKDPIKHRLDFIAQSHSLTQREREVLEFAYKGMTNPEIADQLIISKYTVKRHMHNIFEKLDISTRMELVHLVGPGNGPGGRL